MAYLQYFGAGLTALGIMTVIFSIISPEQGGSVGTVVLGILAFVAGVAVFVVAGRRASRTE